MRDGPIMKDSNDNKPETDASGPQAIVPDALITADLVRQELTRLLSSQTFQAAKAQKQFLGFVVERTIAGCAHELKEYTVGEQVFKRGQHFDPRLDTIVRVEARKLRIRLAKYYESEGKHNPLRIELPSGGYVPNFRQADLVDAFPEASSDSTQDDGADPGGARSTSANVALRVSPEFSAEKEGRAAPATSSARFAWRWLTAGVICALLMLTGVAIYIFGGRLFRATGTAFPVAPSIVVLPFQSLGNI